jgi:hypothetical protein
MTPDTAANELKLNPDDLYREEVFTDRRAGAIRRLTPVKSDGSDDPGRPIRYVGQAQLLTPMGALPLSFEIEADSLEGAIGQFPEAVKQAVDRTIEEAEKMRRDAASSIVVPNAGDVSNLPGGGKLKMP